MSRIVYLSMPFHVLGMFRVKQVPFLFKVHTLELTCEHLGIPLGHLLTEKQITKEEMSRAILWNAYIAACQQSYSKPKYSYEQAIVWDGYMSKEEREKYVKYLAELLASLTTKEKPTQELTPEQLEEQKKS